MFDFFTDPYPDETMYSVFSRYHKMSGNTNFKCTIKELFGINSVIPDVYFPINLDFFCSQFSNKTIYTPESIINNHTILSIFKLHLPKSKICEIINELRKDKGKGKNIYMKIGLSPSTEVYKSKILRFCKACINDDIKVFGEPYIHKIHQLPGIFICPIHSEVLYKYCIPENISVRGFVDIFECMERLEEENVDNDIFQELLSIAKDIEFVLQYDFSNYEPENIYRKYYASLSKRGLLTLGGKINQKVFTHEFINFYSEKLLNKLGCYFDAEKDSNWLRFTVISQKKYTQPIRHILLIRFLFGDIKNFLNSEILDFYPFGSGPWPCLNPAAGHYMKDVITECYIKKSNDTKKLFGTFTCSCGYIYCRSGPDKSEDDKYKKSRVKEYGHIWKQSLINIIISKKYANISKIAKVLRCSQSTITSYAYDLGVLNYLNSNVNINSLKKNIGIEKNKEELEEAYKKNLLDLRKDEPNLTRTQIRRHLPREYSWLRVNTREWFESVLPNTVKIEKTGTNNISTVNWKQRDEEITRKVINAINEIFAEEKPRRVSMDYISKKINYDFQSSLDKLPLTRDTLQKNIESSQEFQIRKINLVFNKMRNDGRKITFSKIKESAALGHISDNVRKYIEQIINDGLCPEK